MYIKHVKKQLKPLTVLQEFATVIMEYVPNVLLKLRVRLMVTTRMSAILQLEL